MTALDLLIDLHIDGDRQGPGSEAHTKKAIDLLKIDTERTLKIIDIGCGTGAQTLVIAHSLNAEIKAVDLSSAFLNRLNENARNVGLGDAIQTVEASMKDLPFENVEFDVIWSEGAIYSMGFRNGLKAWKRYLKQDGYIAVSEICWLKENIPDEVRTFWNDAYAEIDSVENKIKVIEEAGYRMVGHFILPEECWMKNYYQPLLDRTPAFLEKHKHSEFANAIVESERKEIQLYEKYRDCYSYGFFVAQKAD